MPGPPRTPTAILAARGSWLAKTRKTEPRLPVERPSCPKWLSKEAKAEWRRQVKALEEMGVLARCDRAMLTIYCEAWAEFVQAVEALAKSGVLIKDKRSGTFRKNPLLAIRNRAMQRMMMVAAQFGFTPAARARLQISVGSPPEASFKSRFFGAN